MHKVINKHPKFMHNFLIDVYRIKSFTVKLDSYSHAIVHKDILKLCRILLPIIYFLNRKESALDF